MFQCQQVDNLIDIENTRMCYTVYILIMYLYDCCNNFNINSIISIIILSIIFNQRCELIDDDSDRLKVHKYT